MGMISKDDSVSLETWNDFLLGSWLLCLGSWIGGKPSDVEGFRDYEGSARGSDAFLELCILQIARLRCDGLQFRVPMSVAAMFRTRVSTGGAHQKYSNSVVAGWRDVEDLESLGVPGFRASL